MKKILALVLSLVCILSVFSGCANDTTSNPNIGVKSGNAIEVTWWCSSTGEWEFWEKLVYEFNTTYGKEKNVFINMQGVPEGADMVVALENGTAPDIVGIGNLAMYAEAGYLVPLNEVDLLKDLVEKTDFYKEGTNGWQGKTYCIPTSTRLYGLAYNKDMFKAAGLVDENGEAKPPKSWDEVREYAKILTDKSKRQFGIVLPLGWSSWLSMEVQTSNQSSVGYNIFDPATMQYDMSGFRYSLDAIMGMKADGSVYPGEQGLDNDAARARFAEGNIGMKMTASWDIAVWNDQFPAKCDWGVAPLPTATGEDVYYQYCEYSFSSGINARSYKDKGEAIAIAFEYLYGEATQAKAYEQGYYFPYLDLGDDVKVSVEKHGWNDFAALLPASKCATGGYKRLMAPDFGSLQDQFVKNVWSGKVTVDQWIQNMTKAFNAGVTEYNKENPGEDQSYIKDYDWATKINN